MSDHIALFGDYDEILIVAERIISIEGIPETDRANQVVMYSNGVNPSHPRWIGSAVGLDNGTTITVPQGPQEVAKRRHDAIMRQGMLPW